VIEAQAFGPLIPDFVEGQAKDVEQLSAGSAVAFAEEPQPQSIYGHCGKWCALDRVLPILIARYPRGRGSLDTIGAIAAGVGNVGHFSFSVKA
jgi:hypothetical protein